MLVTYKKDKGVRDFGKLHEMRQRAFYNKSLLRRMSGNYGKISCTLRYTPCDPSPLSHSQESPCKEKAFPGRAGSQAAAFDKKAYSPFNRVCNYYQHRSYLADPGDQRAWAGPGDYQGPELQHPAYSNYNAYNYNYAGSFGRQYHAPGYNPGSELAVFHVKHPKKLCFT